MTIAVMTMRRITAMAITLQIREFTEAKCSYSVTIDSFDISNGKIMFFHFG